MGSTIRFSGIKLESGWLMLKPLPEDMWVAMGAVRNHKDRMYDCQISEHREKRSLDANAYAWVLLGKLSKALRLPVEEVYRGYIKDLGDNYVPMCIREKDVEQFKRTWQSHGIGWVVGDLGESQVKGVQKPRSLLRFKRV